VLSELFEWLLVLPGWFPGSLVFLLPALEAPAFLGLVLPGELALILGGVLAQQGRLSLPGALALGVAGAVAGDAAGWWLGWRWGGRLRRTAGPLGRLVRPDRLAAVEARLAASGWVALPLGRLTAGVRVLLPGVAGMAGLPFGAFLARTAPAAAVWAATHVLFGSAAGSGFQRAQAAAGRGGWLLLGVVVVVLAAGLALRAARRHRAAARVTADPAAPASCAGTPPR